MTTKHAIATLAVLLLVPANVGAQGPAPDTARLVADVGALVQPTMSARRQALLRLLRERGFEPRLHGVPAPRATPEGETEGQNIEVVIGSGSRTIILGAHYDAVWLQDGSLSRGAVDNAAGTIVMTRVADALRAAQLRHEVRVVFFDLEEWGLIGSKHYAQNVDTARIAAMVNLDIAGFGDAIAFGPAASPGNAALYDALWEVCGRRGMNCTEFPRYPPSDDLSFQAAGVPNVSIGIMPRLQIHQMWLLLNGGADAGLSEQFAPGILRIIHTPYDTLENVDAKGMALAIDAVTRLVLELDRTLR